MYCSVCDISEELSGDSSQCSTTGVTKSGMYCSVCDISKELSGDLESQPQLSGISADLICHQFKIKSHQGCWEF